MEEAPIPADEAARLRELYSYGVLDTPPEEAFDDISCLVQDISGAKIGVVTIVDENRQWFKSCVGLEGAPSETPRNVSFCGHTIVHRKPLIINDALEDERFFDNPLVTDYPHIRFYAGFPLIAANGMMLGSLCAIDQEPLSLTPRQITALERLARQVVSQLELRREAQLHGSTQRALQGQKETEPDAIPSQPLGEATPTMNREQLLQMLTLMLELDQPPCFSLARCKFVDHSRLCSTLGPATANELIRSAQERLRSCLPPQASLAWLSENELAVLLPHLSEESSVAEIAESCVASLKAPIKQGNFELELHISVGVVIFKNNYSDTDSLLADAKIAQRLAITNHPKSSSFHFIDLPSRVSVQQQHQVEIELRRTIRRNKSIPYLQPIVDLATGAPLGLECLMRWRNDSGEILLPNRFLTISALAGLSGELDLQVIEKAIQASHSLATAFQGRPLQLSVNLSALLLENKAVRERLLQLVRSTPMPKGWQLQVELVEDYLQDNGSELGAFLNNLRRQGVSIAIDDFGTGHFSLSQLPNYPVRTVKVDSSFVQRINDPLNASNQLLKSIQVLCSDLGLDTTAKGVETEAQRSWLLKNGFRQGQGYLFCRPMSVQATCDYLAQLQ